jgi:hypothetical protein
MKSPLTQSPPVRSAALTRVSDSAFRALRDLRHHRFNFVPNRLLDPGRHVDRLLNNYIPAAADRRL